MTREIHVYGDWQELGECQRIGLMRVNRVHGRETFSFEYDPEWLAGNNTLVLDPELSLFLGPQYLNDRDKANFGLFLDSSPDRWGQIIMKRREALVARQEARAPNALLQSDFLLGVHDEQRMGGLRFKEDPNGAFLSNHNGNNVPPWTRLRELENAAWQFQTDSDILHSENNEWLHLLIAPGSSIGGARPKAGVCDEIGNLWIAKFPGKGDEIDKGAWEMVIHTLAVRAGIDVTEARTEKFGRPHHTFLTKRFDRVVVDGARQRRHFTSAMTMLGYSDGTNHSDGASYLEIVEFLTRHGADVDVDLPELWRRIVFSICVSNTDDHLRNHGFLLTDRGWRLSPAYDINPEPMGFGLHLNITETDNFLSLDLAKVVSGYFRVDHKLADQIISEVSASVRAWPEVASDLGISRGEQELLRPAFRIVE
ncbi:MAG: HipA domain-containing protein [Pirellulaceae bacterium]